MNDLEGFVLIGGRSRRMGRDKAVLPLGTQSFVERIVAAVRVLTERVTLIGGETSRHDLPQVPDLIPHYGALGGLRTALTVCRQPWALIVACDLPFINADFLRALWEQRADYEAVVPVQTDGRYQPLCAFYARARCLTVAEDLMAAGERRPRALIERVRTRSVLLDSLPAVDPLTLANVNTPEEYAEALRRLPELNP